MGESLPKHPTGALGAKACTRTQICFDVPNNARLSIDYISDAIQFGRLLISIDGDIYDSGVYVHPNLSAFTIYNAAGKPLSGCLSMRVSQDCNAERRKADHSIIEPAEQRER